MAGQGKGSTHCGCQSRSGPHCSPMTLLSHQSSQSCPVCPIHPQNTPMGGRWAGRQPRPGHDKAGVKELVAKSRASGADPSLPVLHWALHHCLALLAFLTALLPIPGHVSQRVIHRTGWGQLSVVQSSLGVGGAPADLFRPHACHLVSSTRAGCLLPSVQRASSWTLSLPFFSDFMPFMGTGPSFLVGVLFGAQVLM